MVHITFNTIVVSGVLSFFFFFQSSEEARKMWQKQEANWNNEQEARDSLMRDVLVTLQKQVRFSTVYLLISLERVMLFQFSNRSAG